VSYEEEVNGRTNTAGGFVTLRLARVVEVVAPGAVGPHVGVHYYELQQVARTTGEERTTTTIEISSKPTKVVWEIDSPANVYLANPSWLRGLDKVVSTHQQVGTVPDEDVVPLHRVVGEAFALELAEGDVYPRVIPKALFRVWKDKAVIPKAARDSFVLWSSRTGTRSDPATSPLRNLTYAEVKAMSAEETRLACEARDIPTTLTRDGKIQKVKFLQLKEELRKWVDVYGKEDLSGKTSTKRHGGKSKTDHGNGSE
jgi:hypothetical protein